MFLILVLVSYVYTFFSHVGSSDEVCHFNAVVPFDALRQSRECPQVKIYRCRLDTLSAETRFYGWANIATGNVSLTAIYQRIDKHHALSRPWRWGVHRPGEPIPISLYRIHPPSRSSRAYRWQYWYNHPVVFCSRFHAKWQASM
jgi:hypothetical protein